MAAETRFQIIVAIAGSLTGALCALAYFRHVRLERPPIGAFNSRDLSVLACFIVTLPMLYLIVPAGVLTGLLVLTFLSALMIALRPLVSTRLLWIAIPVLLAANLLETRSISAIDGGLQIYWVLTSLVVMIAAVGVANLYVQGGLRLCHVAWFTLFLAVYDFFFTNVVPLTAQLAIDLQGRPLDPSIGFATATYNANVGLGDLLVFCMYATAAYKGFGRRGALVSLFVIVIFGALAPSVTPLLVPGLFGTTAAAFVPVMTVFGPAVFISYLWLSRTAPERSAVQWITEQAGRLAAASPARRPRLGIAVPSAGLAGLVLATLLWSGETATNASARLADQAVRLASRASLHGGAIVVRDLAFSPHATTVKVGETVTWINEDRIGHNVTATSGASFASGTVGQGQTFQFRPSRPGTIRYLCTLHQGMAGTLIVTAK
jgi:plastocyanin